MCKQQQAVIFQPQNDYDLRRIGEYLLSQSDAYAAWIYPSEVVSQGDVLTDEAITCKAVISPKFAIDIRMDTSEEKGSLHKSYPFPVVKIIL
ncbi:Latrophilin3like [Caligus rogercresseyi]|uniref:Latrophilin3like n=1 Tax=Caligus rogercresseyi TaxID=217165 RepID=A0A7T8KCR4_CALRO|nr:Latrophilin3like [Caligus rogercresseyi]